MAFAKNKEIQFVSFFLNFVSIFITLFLSEIKKYFFFLKNFKYKESFNTFFGLVFLKLNSVFVI